MTFAFVFALAVLAISLIVPGLRTVTFNLLAAAAWTIYDLTVRIFGAAPGWLAATATWLSNTATAAGATIADVTATTARFIGGSLVILTLVLAAAVAFQNLTVLVAVAVLLGTLSMAIRWPLTWLKLTHKMAARLSTAAQVLFWISVLMLFLPMFTTDISLTTLTIIILCSTILLIIPFGEWFQRIRKYSTAAILTLLVVVSLVAPLRHWFMDLRYSNLNQTAVVATKEQIEDLQQQIIQHGGVPTDAEQKQLEDLTTRSGNQQKMIDMAAARRTASSSTSTSTSVSGSTSSTWLINTLRDFDPITLLIIAGGVLLMMYAVAKATAQPKSGH